MDGDTRGLGPRASSQTRRTSQASAAPTRRVLLVGVGAAALASLTDRGLRLDLPQPPPPIPTRRRVPDEALLIAVARELDTLLAHVPTGGKSRAAVADVKAVLRRQRSVIVGRLTNQGVPSSEIKARPTPSATASTRPLGVDDFAESLTTVAPDRWSTIARATADARGLLWAAYATRLACSAVLGRPLALPGTPSPARPALAALTHPIGYAFEVVAAQSVDGQRERALTTLTDVQELAREVGDTSEPGGWALPFPVTDPDSARRLAEDVLRKAYEVGITAAGANPTGAALEDTAHWTARVLVIARPWGNDLVAFPGTGG